MSLAQDFREGLSSRTLCVGVIGLGYVGLPLARAFCDAGLRCVGFDTDPEKVRKLSQGQSYIHHIPPAEIARMRQGDRFVATGDFANLRQCGAILICVPTPLTQHREPDLSFIVSTAESIAPHLQRGQLVSLESTTYPGTTDEVLRPILERGGLKAGQDFFLAFSPEREDPGNPKYETRTIPKVVGADDKTSQELAVALYGTVVARVVPVSSTRAAEAVKLTENIFRSINIALVNELKLVYEKMSIDVWEVIDTASTKPFGFMPFYPGPGLGGHCVPIDPFYLTWKAREFDVPTRFIELAGEINVAMPLHVVRRLAESLDSRFGAGLRGARILVLGVAYKKNVDDTRESPALRILDLLRARGAQASYFDPYVPVIPPTREHAQLTGTRSITWSPQALAEFQAALVVTDHDQVDYAELVAHSRLVVDTRNATKGVREHRDRIVKA
ncbi:MAG TPA: nucleotide sugar dehydrogenase [bacterium]|nr:nucleotide sugar dehydrogenase [bacterium]